MMKFTRGQPVCTLLFSSDGRILQSMKTSVCSILNSSSTDVFVFSDKRLSKENKRVQTGITVGSAVLFHTIEIFHDIQRLNF